MDEIFSLIENFVSNRIHSIQQNGSNAKQVRSNLHYIIPIIIYKYDFQSHFFGKYAIKLIPPNVYSQRICLQNQQYIFELHILHDFSPPWRDNSY